MYEVVRKRVLAAGLTITNIRRGEGLRDQWIYAELRDRDGNLVISATLDYIVDELRRAAIEKAV